MKRIVLLPLVCLAAIAPPMAYAGAVDGTEDFSLKPDASGGGPVGTIYFSHENMVFGQDFILPTAVPAGAPAADADALSAHHRAAPHNHGVTLADMIAGEPFMKYSLCGSSDIHEWVVSGSEPVPNGIGRTLTYEHLHDSAAVLGLSSLDLDALESHEHTPPYPFPYPGPPTTWETDPTDAVYFSVENVPLGNTLDDGDVYVTQALAPPITYVDDSVIAAALASLGFVHDGPNAEQLDALIVYDVLGNLTTFDAGTDKWDSDAIFFSLAPGAVDPIGDNVYWCSASGVGGLYGDPGLSENVDALDIHPVPEPLTVLAVLLGVSGLSTYVRKRVAAKA